MNQLSWLIYLAGVSGNLQGFLIFLCIALGIGGMISGGIGFAMMHDAYDDDDRKKIKVTLKFSKTALIAMIGFGVFSSVMPDRNTLYAIAVSEMGERVLSTPTAGKAFKALDAWLDDQIKEAEKPAE